MLPYFPAMRKTGSIAAIRRPSLWGQGRQIDTGSERLPTPPVTVVTSPSIEGDTGEAKSDFFSGKAFLSLYDYHHYEL